MSLHLFSVGKKFRRVSAGNFFGLFLSNAEGFREDFQGWFPYLRSIRFQGKCSVSWFGIRIGKKPNYHLKGIYEQKGKSSKSSVLSLRQASISVASTVFIDTVGQYS